MIAQLAVAAAVYAIDKPYSYRVPEGMQVHPADTVLDAIAALDLFDRR